MIIGVESTLVIKGRHDRREKTAEDLQYLPGLMSMLNEVGKGHEKSQE